MNTHVHPTPYFGAATLAPIGPLGRQVGISPIEFRTSFLNNMSFPVTIACRSGLKMTLPPLHNFDEPKQLVVRVEITLTHSVKLDIHRLLSVVDETSTSELKAMKEGFKLSGHGNKYGNAVLILDYPITPDALRKAGGTIYYNEIDTVISLLSFHDCPPHPASEAGRNIQLIESHQATFGDHSFNYAIELIDNLGKYGDRYLNIGNKVYRVTARQDSTRRDGVYVLTHHPVDSSLEMSEKEIQHYPFEGAEEKLGLFRTAEEALNLGDISLARRQQILNLEQEIQISKRELTLIKQDHDREMADKERAMKLLEMESEKQSRIITEMRSAEEHRLKLERERVKDYFEDKSYRRKNDSEILKFLPSVIVGFGAIIVAIRNIWGGSK